MGNRCCRWHTNTCGHLDTCCEQCPTLRESDLQLYLLALLGVVVLVLAEVALA